ncbi:enoyl-CoA hydratase-related protein [Solihabitans fulvus]|uniref:enoyl-CoA hydratase-related protein n=1 Tax=Solihabitans fulvus TaxID=1892852 RepID=UPI001CB75CDB|nr:enoyl-CoA hydratase-related protein [Solihabitans fulvus]
METVRYEVGSGVATITLNRPDRLNAVTPEMGGAVNEALRRAELDPDVRAVVLTGAGRGFCAGADLALFEDDAAALRDATSAEGLRPELALRSHKPVIAAVNGPAAGVGFALMLHCDLRFVAERASLTTSFARLGLVAEYGMGWLLPRIVGVSAAMDLLLSGRRISGTEAVEIGLAQRALPAEEVLPAAWAYAAGLARECSPRSLAAIKAQVYRGLDDSFPKALDESRELMVQSLRSPDLPEGAAAFAEGRPPRFAPLDTPE